MITITFPKWFQQTGKNPWVSTVKPLNSGQLRVLKNLSVIKRCPLLGGSLTEIVTFGLNILSAIQGMSAVWDVFIERFHCTMKLE